MTIYVIEFKTMTGWYPIASWHWFLRRKDAASEVRKIRAENSRDRLKFRVARYKRKDTRP